MANNSKQEIVRCTHCGSGDYKKNGRYQGSQRDCCRDCGRAFSDKVRKFTYADKERFLDLYLNNVGIRKAARFMGCSSSLPIVWLRQFADNLKRRLARSRAVLDRRLPDVIEMDEIYTRIKKGAIGCRYGLLILDDGVRLWHRSSAEKKPAR
jgi:transposase-like protein